MLSSAFPLISRTDLVNFLNIGNMIIEVEKRDIDNIGHTAYSENGNLSLVCSTETSGIEQILLRNILKCFGDQYKIVDEYDTDSEAIENSDIVFETNLPYSIYLSACE